MILQNHELYLHIKEKFINSGRTNGTKQIAKSLQVEGIVRISHKKVLRYFKLKNIVPNNHVKRKVKVEKPEKIGKYPNLLSKSHNIGDYGDVFSVDVTEKEFNGQIYYTCDFYHIKLKKYLN